ncbi:uncharacterized protein LOC144710310 isoform X2 [Wolffia australiana]
MVRAVLESGVLRAVPGSHGESQVVQSLLHRLYDPDLLRLPRRRRKHCRRRKHLILQVVRSSYQAAVQIDGTNRLGKLFGEEDDDIQVYRANRVRIYYLHSRGPSKAEAGRASPFLYGACSWPLLDADKRYFSISCKLSSCPRKNTAGSATISATLPSRTPSGSTATTSPASGARGISGRPSFQGDRPCFNRC